MLHKSEIFSNVLLDSLTNQKTTVIAPKEFVTFEKIGENEIPSVEITTITLPKLNYYGDLIKESKTSNREVKINKYVVRS